MFSWYNLKYEDIHCQRVWASRISCMCDGNFYQNIKRIRNWPMFSFWLWKLKLSRFWPDALYKTIKWQFCSASHSQRFAEYLGKDNLPNYPSGHSVPCLKGNSSLFPAGSCFPLWAFVTDCRICCAAVLEKTSLCKSLPQPWIPRVTMTVLPEAVFPFPRSAFASC